MIGTKRFQLETTLDLEMDYSFTPGRRKRITADPNSSYPEEPPEYEIGDIRARHRGKYQELPDWLWEIIKGEHGDGLLEIIKQSIKESSIPVD